MATGVQIWLTPAVCDDTCYNVTQCYNLSHILCINARTGDAIKHRYITPNIETKKNYATIIIQNHFAKLLKVQVHVTLKGVP